jgi:hypothetical protein
VRGILLSCHLPLKNRLLLRQNWVIR